MTQIAYKRTADKYYAIGIASRVEMQSMIIGTLADTKNNLKAITIYTKGYNGYNKERWSKRIDPIDFLANLNFNRYETHDNHTPVKYYCIGYFYKKEK